LSQDAEVGVKWNVQRGCCTSHSRSIVVDDGMDRLTSRGLSIDDVEESHERLVPMALHIAADDGAVENVEGANRVVVPWRL
jgi:hypothetical protein